LQAKERLMSSFKEIQQTLAELHDLFAGDGEEVQREWVKFTVKADKKVEDALRHTVKRSLQEMSRLLNGDSKTEVLPIFRCAGIPCFCFAGCIVAAKSSHS
jgi:dynein heavy chain